MKKTKLLPLIALTGFLFAGGCSFNGLLSNIWIGFGRAIGGVPAQVVTDVFLADFINNLVPQ